MCRAGYWLWFDDRESASVVVVLVWRFEGREIFWRGTRVCGRSVLYGDVS